MIFLKEKMKNILKLEERRKSFRYFRLYNSLGIWNRKRKQSKAIIKWLEDGKPVPPPHIYQQAVLRQYAKEYGLKVFVETGTYCGDMVKAMIGTMDKIYSIELGEELYNRTKKRFKNENSVFLIQGDSGSVLEKIIQHLDEPALFWLDGHFCGELTGKGEVETPIYKELELILSSTCNEHVIIIDDARLFVNRRDYPTIDEIIQFVNSKNDNYNVCVRDDSFRITPKLKDKF